MRLVMMARAGVIKQGTSGPVELDFTGSDTGVDLQLELAAERYKIDPTTLALARAGERKHKITLAVPRDGASGKVQIPITARPKLAGFEDRAVTATLEVTIQPLTFWERHGTKVLMGIGGLVLLLLLGGVLSPAKFPRRAMLHYQDVRDPDLERKSSYPLGTKAKRGFYRPARVHVGPSGPVKKGGTVVVTALAGNRVQARPLSPSARVQRVPGPEMEGAGFTPARGDDEAAGGERSTIPLKEGAFAMSPGTRYEIEGSGLVFWYETK
jgi:hypothetical protein